MWLDTAHADPPESVRKKARVRILAYNEDDVRATVALRGRLAALKSIE